MQDDVTLVLLESGADPNKPFPRHLLAHVVRRYGEKGPAAERIFSLLVSHGIEIKPEVAESIFKYCDSEMLLAMAVPSFKHTFEAMVLSGAFARVLSQTFLDDSWLPKVRNILEHDYADSVRRSDAWNEAMTMSLSAAALTSKTEVISLLLAAGAQPSIDCFINAVESNNMEVFERFLNLGLDPNARNSFTAQRLYSSTFYSMLPTKAHTALSRCIDLKFKEAFKVLENRGFLAKAGDSALSLRLSLVAASTVGDDALVRKFLSFQEIRSQEDMVEAIDVAVNAGQENIVQQLLSAGIRPNHASLFRAVKNKNSILAELLLSIVPLQTRYYAKPWEDILLEAVLWGNADFIKTLVRAGVSINNLVNIHLDQCLEWPPEGREELPYGCGPWNVTPLVAAILKGECEVAEFLLCSGAQFNVHDWNMPKDDIYWPTMTVLTACVIKHDRSLLQELLRKGADPFDNNTILMAVALGEKKMVKYLLYAFTKRYRLGAKSYGLEALFWATYVEDIEMLELLAPFTDASGNVSVGDLIIDDESESEFDGDTRSPLAEAIRLNCLYGSFEGLPILLDQVKDLDTIAHQTYTEKMTPLWYAIHLGSLETVRILIKAGANMSLPAMWRVKRTPLQAAVENGRLDIVRYLLEEGVDPNEPPAASAGATALQLAANKGFISLASILLNVHADVNAKPACLMAEQLSRALRSMVICR